MDARTDIMATFVAPVDIWTGFSRVLQMLTFQVSFLVHPKQSMSFDIKLYIKYNCIRILLKMLWINGHLRKTVNQQEPSQASIDFSVRNIIFLPK